MDSFTRAYFETALWASSDNSDDQGGEPLDKNYDVGDIDDATRDKMIADCASFQERFGELIGGNLELAGHDFWLTRNGAGAGFWDGDWPEPDATKLTDGAHEYGEFDLYVGDPDEDGETLIYGSPLDAHVGESRRRGVVAAPRRSASRTHRVSDFGTLQDLIEHAATVDGATHVSGAGANTRIYFPCPDNGYYVATVWQKEGYWHAQGPGARSIIAQLPRNAMYLPGDTEARRGAPRRHAVRDYEALDNHNRVIAGPFKSYGDAKTEAERVRGVVRFVPSGGRQAPPRARESGHGKQFEVVNPDGRVISHITAPTIERAQTDLARGKNAGFYPRGSRIKGARMDEAPRPTRSAHNPNARRSTRRR
jgi:hypothetical protein